MMAPPLLYATLPLMSMFMPATRFAAVYAICQLLQRYAADYAMPRDLRRYAAPCR